MSDERSTSAEPPVRYFVCHETRYRYEYPVGMSRQLLRLQPREVPWQKCTSHSLVVAPTPQQLVESVDAFGNPVKSLVIETDHEALRVRAESWIELASRTVPSVEETPPWEEVRARLAYRGGERPIAEDLDAARFLFESARVRSKRVFAEWAAESFPSGTPLLEGVRTLMERIHREFAYDPKATTVSTPVTEVFTRRRGVCQDFAHLMLSCLRSIGLAARYVSGYLLTRPPPGKPRLVGADASHAWVSVYCPDIGWIDADPTNAVFPNLEHVTLGWGRDFDDVTPMRGVLLGGGAHRLDIQVTVAPSAEYDALFGSPAANP